MNGRKKVTVVGAGNVGATCAQELARRDYADVVLLDVKPNFAAGKALDINQAGSVLGYEPTVVGVDGSGYAATAGSDVVVITAGLTRPPCWPALLRLLGHVAGGQRSTLAKEEIFHVPGHQFLRLLLPRHQAVLVENHLLSVFPQLPRLCGDILEQALTELARPRRGVETRKLLLELHAVHHAAGLVADRRLGSGGAIIHARHVTPLMLDKKFDAEPYAFQPLL